jgi:hypothetical protein
MPGEAEIKGHVLTRANDCHLHIQPQSWLSATGQSLA